jgi:ribonuclease HI
VLIRRHGSGAGGYLRGRRSCCIQNSRPQHHTSNYKSSWAKPPPCLLKCNVDAATFNNNTIMGYNMCFRDSMEKLLIGMSGYSQISATVLEAESMGLLEAIKTATSNGLQRVWFEIDSRSLVNALNTSNTPLNEFWDLVFQCKNLLLNNPDFVVSFVRRQANKVAHSIARAALSHPSPMSSMMYPLLCAL